MSTNSTFCVQVDKKTSRELQSLAFANGYKWYFGGTEYSDIPFTYYDIPCLIFLTDKTISYWDIGSVRRHYLAEVCISESEARCRLSGENPAYTIVMTQEEIDTLYLVCNSIGGPPINSLRKHTISFLSKIHPFHKYCYESSQYIEKNYRFYFKDTSKQKQIRKSLALLLNKPVVLVSNNVDDFFGALIEENSEDYQIRQNDKYITFSFTNVVSVDIDNSEIEVNMQAKVEHCELDEKS